MIANDDIGARLKACRQQLGLTLKAVESKAEVSATHISEIERGKTSPTVSALSRIASALGREVAYFLEEHPLEDVCVLSESDRKSEPLPWSGGVYSALSSGIPGALLRAYQLKLDPQSSESHELRVDCTQLFWVQSGSVRFDVDGTEYLLEGGDSIHIGQDCPHHLSNIGDGQAELVLLTGARDALANSA